MAKKAATGHAKLVTPELMSMVVEHGRERFLPHPRVKALLVDWAEPR